MTILISGSLAFDRIMDFPGKFSDHILPDKIHILNVCFAINALRENFGGTAGNIGYALSLLGEKPCIIAAAGRDFDPYRRWLSENGLSLEYVTIVENELTAGAYITTDLSDNQITAFNPGAMNHQSTREPDHLGESTDFAIVAPGNLDDMIRLARRYRKNRVPFIFDPGQSLPAWDPALLVEAIDGAELFISNDYELELATAKTGLTLGELLERTPTVITTRGEEGSLIQVRDDGSVRTMEVPAVPPLEVRDPTGAGDAYRAGLIKGLLSGRDNLLHAARLGAVCAAYAVEVYGTQTFRFTPEAFSERFDSVFG